MVYVSYARVCVLSRFSHVQLCATLWTVAHQAPLSMGFSRQERRGLTPRGSLGCNPEIPAFPGEEYYPSL